jgi:hypothetical protein
VNGGNERSWPAAPHDHGLLRQGARVPAPDDHTCSAMINLDPTGIWLT